MDQPKSKLKPPTSGLSADDKATAISQNEMEFKADFDVYMKPKQFYEANTTKAYALLWEQCSQGIQGKIEANKNFKSTIKSKPIDLLKIIKQNCLNYDEHNYEMPIIMDLIKTLFIVKQKEHG
jgi:hypothetical protein